jgi:hypothetical protein
MLLTEMDKVQRSSSIKVDRSAHTVHINMEVTAMNYM